MQTMEIESRFAVKIAMSKWSVPVMTKKILWNFKALNIFFFQLPSLISKKYNNFLELSFVQIVLAEFYPKSKLDRQANFRSCSAACWGIEMRTRIKNFELIFIDHSGKKHFGLSEFFFPTWTVVCRTGPYNSC